MNGRGTHITIDARMLSTAGIGTYLTEMLPRVVARLNECRFTILGDPPVIAEVTPPSSRVAIGTLLAPIYSLWEQAALSRAIPADTTVLWSPHFNIPIFHHGPLAVTVHDVAHLALPQASPLRSAYARLMFRVVARRARIVFCDSAFTAGELARYTGRRVGVQVSHLGVAPRWFEQREPAPIGGPYFLYVGNVKPHKNLPRLLAAFGGLPAAIPHRLVIVGRREGMLTVDRSIDARRASLGSRVVFSGHVTQDELETLVRGCDALVLPSLYEGFGLPPLEAMACGRPVAVSRIASLPEVCGPDAEYFDPRDVASISGALQRLATRPPDTPAVIARRRAWAHQFDWERCAEETVEGLLRASAGRSTATSAPADPQHALV